jgi:hypothetical protein
MKHKLFHALFLCSILFLLSSCSLGGTSISLPQDLPFLYKKNNQGMDLSWYKALINLKSGLITESDHPIAVQNQASSDLKLYWNGKNVLFSFSAMQDNKLLAVNEKELSVFHQAVDSSPYLVFSASKDEQQVLAYLPAQASRRDEVMVEIFGKKAQKLTLRMPSDDFAHLRILKPLAILANDGKWEFFFQTIENSPDKSKVGIIKAIYDYSSIKWKVLVKQMPFPESASGISMAYHQGSLYFSSQEGVVWTLSLKSGKIRKHDPLTKEIEAFRNQSPIPRKEITRPSFFSFEDYLIIACHAENNESIHLLVAKHKLRHTIKYVNDEITLYAEEGTFPIKLPLDMPLPVDWYFPGP